MHTCMCSTSSLSNVCSSLLHSNLPCWFLPRSGQTDVGKQKLTSATHSLINFPAIVSHDYSVIALALNNIFCPKKLSIQRVYVAVARFDSRQQLGGCARASRSNKSSWAFPDDRRGSRLSLMSFQTQSNSEKVLAKEL